MPSILRYLPRLRARGLLGEFFLGLVLAGALLLRVLYLSNIPGINGDEAWYGVQMQELAARGSFTVRTPTGRLFNPFHSGPLYLLQLVFPPSFWLLRLPALVAGILLIILGYLLLRRVVAPQTAFLSAFLLAVLPINIAYSRFGWDPSQSTLLCLIASYFALAGNPLATTAAFLSSLLVHPSNFFIAPALAGPFVARGVRSLRQHGIKAAVRAHLRVEWALAILVLLTALVFLFPGGYAPRPAVIMIRLLELRQWKTYANFYSDLLSGLTTYRYIVGEPDPAMTAVHDYGFPVLILVLLLLGGRRLFRRRDSNELGMVFGTVIAAVSFFLVAGPRAMQPHLERYAMFLVVPTVLSLSFLLAAVAELPSGEARLRLITGGVGFLLLVSFSWNYFREIATTGGRSHPTFRTAAVEPKAQALFLIHKLAAPGWLIWIVADEWWTYWPIRYLAAPDRSTMVTSLNHPSEVRDVLARGAFLVGFPGGPSDRFLRQHGQSLLPIDAWRIPSYSGEAALLIWRAPSAGKRPPP